MINGLHQYTTRALVNELLSRKLKHEYAIKLFDHCASNIDYKELENEGLGHYFCSGIDDCKIQMSLPNGEVVLFDTIPDDAVVFSGLIHL